MRRRFFSTEAVRLVMRGPSKPSRRRKKRLMRNYIDLVAAVALHQFTEEHGAAFAAECTHAPRAFRRMARACRFRWERADATRVVLP